MGGVRRLGFAFLYAGVLAAVVPALADTPPAFPSSALATEPDGDGPASSQPKRTKLRNRKPEAAGPAYPQPTPPVPPSATGPESHRETQAQANGWSVILAIFRGEDHAEAAQALLARVRTEGGLPEAFAQKRGQATLIGAGLFPSGDSPEAKELLGRVRELQVGGARPYAGAYLAPPASGAAQGSLPQFNLLRARELFGATALYTLQVGVYGRDDLDRPSERDLGECRRAAEQGAARLRQDGELAFYHHGVRRSMVTVGVFDITDYDPQAPSFKSARLRDAQKRFPYNLYNGEGIREKIKGFTQARLQPSNLVALPGK